MKIQYPIFSLILLCDFFDYLVIEMGGVGIISYATHSPIFQLLFPVPSIDGSFVFPLI